MTARVLFLPGASGSRTFWKPVADRLPEEMERVLLGWPGFDGLPEDPHVRSLSDLVDLVASQIKSPVNLVAQSMGGVVALQVALRLPGMVRRIVLAATSGGTDMTKFAAVDWRPNYLLHMPRVPRWFVDDRTDVSTQLPILKVPALLIWGDGDPITPVKAGEYLAELLPRATLVVIEGGGHALANERADEVAPLIAEFLSEVRGVMRSGY